MKFFQRDGVHDLIDGDVYTSEIPWTKPSPKAFGAAMAAVGATDPTRCVYVGDRLFDDIWGAHNAGLKAIHIPLSTIPANRVGHTEGTPDAVVHSLAEIPAAVAAPGMTKS
ncbi:HAD family hydrolase [Nocardioides sp. B-3]|uniref:HAD family hydrolase n=1 Tax=Nocardioides sp. B-3 TaxID=2895565 RepID=UPI0021527748|nr:HAD-IA family hydrolase [Nocardioides sp. B-3]UUZ59786.1 HAD-IA family hydrolase [Nocardioides sp. B-3]